MKLFFALCLIMGSSINGFTLSLSFSDTDIEISPQDLDCESSDTLTDDYFSDDKKEFQRKPKVTSLKELLREIENRASDDLFSSRDLKKIDLEGNTLMHAYAQQHERDHDDDTLNYLIRMGLSPTAKNSLGQTPLMIAARNKSSRFFNLLDVKQNFNTQDNYGDTVLHHAISSPLAKIRKCVKLSRRKRSCSLFGTRRDNEWADISLPTKAKSEIYMPMVRALLDRGARFDIKNKTGVTPFILMIQRSAKRSHVEEVLTRSDIKGQNTSDKKGCTALHYAALCGGQDMVLFLIGYLKIVKNKDGEKPAEFARSFGIDVCDGSMSPLRFEIVPRKHSQPTKRIDEAECIMTADPFFFPCFWTL